MRFSRSTHLLMFLSLETLTSIISTGLPLLVEQIDLVNSVIIFVSQMALLRWLTFLLRSQTVILIVQLFWINFFLLSICSTMAFPPLGSSDHLVVPVSIAFPINSQQGAPFHCIGYDYSCADWDGLFDHLTDVLWEDIFKLGASAAASEFWEWVEVGIDVYIYPSWKISGQVSLLCMVFSCLCCCHSS